jgi:hypothetical protein
LTRITKIAALAAVLLIGPGMYVVSRARSLDMAFSRINVGDSASAVTAVMGRPQREERTKLRLNADVEYHYSVWPIPNVWIVGFRSGKVVAKAQVSSHEAPGAG